jgi:hypothetical protein
LQEDIFQTVRLYSHFIAHNPTQLGQQIIQTVKYADDLVLMAKEETVLLGMIDRLIEIGRCYGMEMNVEKNKSNENFKTTKPSHNKDRPRDITAFKTLQLVH